MNKLLVCSLLIAATQCRASITFSLDSAVQSVALGSSATLTLDVAGLGNGTALGAYDLLVSFDPTVLSFDNVTFGTDLDPDGFGPFQIVTPGPGSVDLFEVSLDPDTDLLALQPDAFTIATIVLDTLSISAGSPVTLSENAIGDQDGNDISGESALNNAAVTVTGASSSTPEPGTTILLSAGMFVIIACHRYRRRLSIVHTAHPAIGNRAAIKNAAS